MNYETHKVKNIIMVYSIKNFPIPIPCLKQFSKNTSMIYSTVFQPGLRGTSGFREWLPGVQPKQTEISIFTHLFFTESRIDTWIIR